MLGLQLVLVTLHRWSLPTHIHSVGQLISNNWETKTWVQLVLFSREPKSVPFSHRGIHSLQVPFNRSLGSCNANMDEIYILG